MGVHFCSHHKGVITSTALLLDAVNLFIDRDADLDDGSAAKRLGLVA